jgi:hypothetical protein
MRPLKRHLSYVLSSFTVTLPLAAGLSLSARPQLAPHVLLSDLAAHHGAEVLEAQAEPPADEQVRPPAEATPAPRPDDREHGVNHQVGADVGLEVAPALQLRRRLQVAVPFNDL